MAVFNKTDVSKDPLGKAERMNWSNSVEFSLSECLLCAGHWGRHHRACDE